MRAGEAPASPADRRRAWAAAREARSAVGALVREAMLRPGDSDPRLLGALGALGVHPAALAPVASTVDPWLAAGLVDLERQVAGEGGAAAFTARIEVLP